MIYESYEQIKDCYIKDYPVNYQDFREILDKLKTKHYEVLDKSKDDDRFKVVQSLKEIAKDILKQNISDNIYKYLSNVKTFARLAKETSEGRHLLDLMCTATPTEWRVDAEEGADYIIASIRGLD